MRTLTLRPLTWTLAAACAMLCIASSAHTTHDRAPGATDRRTLAFPNSDAVWGGTGVCYGPFRDGQAPGKAAPTVPQLREDLHLLARHWRIIRMYGARGSTPEVCRIIREEKLPLRLMVGAWIAPEVRPEEPGRVVDSLAAENRAEVDAAIALARSFPDVVFAINIGNEALVEWSDHRVEPQLIIQYLRLARAAVDVPVTTCDTELFWTRPDSTAVAKECDFLGLHAYAMWNKQRLEEAMDWTRQRLHAVQQLHPDLPIVLCETGWATMKGKGGYQDVGITAPPGEREQELFFRTLRDWAVENRQPYFYFSAFDERWKGGEHPDDVEKHWGVYNADRTPKLVFRAQAQPGTTPATPQK